MVGTTTVHISTAVIFMQISFGSFWAGSDRLVAGHITFRTMIRNGLGQYLEFGGGAGQRTIIDERCRVAHLQLLPLHATARGLPAGGLSWASPSPHRAGPTPPPRN